MTIGELDHNQKGEAAQQQSYYPYGEVDRSLAKLWAQYWSSFDRRTRLAIIVAAQVVAAVGFVLGGPPEDIEFWNGLFDVGHAMLFALLMYTALEARQLAKPEHGEAHRGELTAFGVLVFLAAFSEVMQYFQPTRHPSFGDFLRDVAGSGAVFLLWSARTRAQTGAWSPRFLNALAGGLFIVVLLEFALTIAVYVERDRALPVLLPFTNTHWERRLLRVHGARLTLPAAQHPPSSTSCAPLTLFPGRAPALTLDEPYPDWRSASRLVFSVTSVVEPSVRLRIRVSDAHYTGADDDAFFEDLDIRKGEQRIEIPIDAIRKGPRRRELDMQRIRNITFFVWRPAETIEMCLSPLRLE